jgi:hypothetical protein
MQHKCLKITACSARVQVPNQEDLCKSAPPPMCGIMQRQACIGLIIELEEKVRTNHVKDMPAKT